VHPTLGILARFQAFFYASAFFQSDCVPPPAPARVTQTVSPLIPSKSRVKLNGKQKSKHYQRNQKGRWNSSSNICLCYPIYLACLHFARFAHRFWMETYIYNLGGV
jgi:hypothetical protein